jgi:tetratricopeptide (TPR) repeat protein
MTATAVGLVMVAAAVSRWVLLPQYRARAEWHAALRAMEVDDFAGARKSLAACQKAWPSNAEVSFSRARVERRAGDFSAAREQLLEASKLGWAVEQIDLERTLLEAQKGTNFSPRLRATLNSDPAQAALAYEAMVRGLIQRQAIAEAHVACDEWRARLPDDWRARYWTGWILEKEGRRDLAVEHYRSALGANPDDFNIRFRLAETLLGLSHFDQALPYLEACRTARPEDPAVKLAMARCCQALGRGYDAEAIARSLVQENPKNGSALLLVARLRIAAEDSAGAVDFARRAVALDPGDPVRVSTLAEALRGAKAETEATALEERARQLAEQNERVNSLVSEANYHPHSAEARCTLGKYLASLGRNEEAARWLRNALAVDANYKPAREALDALARAAPPSTNSPPQTAATSPAPH